MKCCIKVLLVVCLLGLGCSSESFAQSTPRPPKSSEGVVLYGCKSDPGWIENTNRAFAVRIRHVYQFSGERTISIDRLEPGERLQLDKVDSQDGFYIYTMDGVMIGWLLGTCPGQKR